jgi:hypothetical protein
MTTLIPHARLGRVLALLWLLACLALLAFAYLKRAAPDMPQAFTWGLIALSFPIGLPAGAAVGMSMSWAYANAGLPYEPFTDLLPSWLVMVLAGYLQWFVGLPAACRWLRRP